MTTNSIYNKIYQVTAFSLPISCGLLFNMLSNFLAVMMLAKLGKVELAASALAIPTFITNMIVVSTIFYSISILISHYRGQNDSIAEIGQIVKNGLWLAVLLSIPSGTLLWNLDKILLLFNQEVALVVLTKQYFHFAAFSMLTTLIGNVILQFFTGIGKPRFTLILSSINLPIMVFLSYGLVLGNFGLPKLGLAGVSCSSLLTQLVVWIGVFFYMHRSKILSHYKIFTKGFWPNLSLCKKIFKLGLPIGIQSGAELAAITVSAYFMGYCGATALASSQIASQYMLLFVMIIIGISQGLSVLVSQSYGKNEYDSIKQYAIASLIILSIFSIMIYTLFTIGSHVLIKLYSDSTDLEFIRLTEVFLLITATILLFDGARNFFAGILRGLQDSKTPMIIGIFCLWCISVPLSYIAAFNIEGGPIGLRLGFLSGFIVASFILWARIQSKIQLIKANKIQEFQTQSI